MGREDKGFKTMGNNFELVGPKGRYENIKSLKREFGFICPTPPKGKKVNIPLQLLDNFQMRKK